MRIIMSLLVLLSPPLGGLLAGNEPPPAPADAPPPLSAHQRTWHALNRLAFGPGPGDVLTVQAMGWRDWFERQLDPSALDDSTLVELIAERFPSLRMDLRTTWEVYWPDLPKGFDELDQPQKDAFFEYRNRQYEIVQQELLDSVILRAVYSKRQFQEVIVDFWRNHFNIDQTKGLCRLMANHYEENVIRKHAFGRFEDMLLASAQHPAMSIYLDNEVSQKPLSKDEREVLEQIRRKRLKDPNAQMGMVATRISRHSGLNENYARELMELHTLGVDNFYSQGDVRELARVLTGWTHGWETVPYGSPYGFVFRHDHHDPRTKVVLGEIYRGKTEEEGVVAIRRLAHHRGTAEFISWKLSRYLVNDEPGAALVEKGARAFRESRGSLRELYRAIVLAPEFFEPSAYLSKFKSPLEFVVSALRATDAHVTDPRGVLFRLARMGQPIYRCEAPTGYFDQTEAWLDPGVFVHRWDFALSLVNGQVAGVQVPATLLEPWRDRKLSEVRTEVVNSLVPAPLGERADALLAKAQTAGQLVGLVLGTPAFQKQ